MDANVWGVHVPLQSGVLHHINDFGFHEILRGSGFNPVASFVSYSRSSQAAWASIDLAQWYYPLEFSSW